MDYPSKFCRLVIKYVTEDEIAKHVKRCETENEERKKKEEERGGGLEVSKRKKEKL
ncbi:hypothetical protein CCACVL1_08720 [Corchorus capsularis]|uniref:Uncharacterized protein n=1 Tax=Corchorus capsularis TaxID=210143 RepID=A0A1R3IZ57_COCAP|nr:hypothetical protein CCACVL1_08720 [Corchorus capsularis]